MGESNAMLHKGCLLLLFRGLFQILVWIVFVLSQTCSMTCFGLFLLPEGPRGVGDYPHKILQCCLGPQYYIIDFSNVSFTTKLRTKLLQPFAKSKDRGFYGPPTSQPLLRLDWPNLACTLTYPNATGSWVETRSHPPSSLARGQKPQKSGLVKVRL